MAGERSTDPILSTKLHRPPVDVNHVHRPHLFERLDQRGQRPLTLVSAPAGYGKTTLVSSWLETSSSPSAWVSLIEGGIMLSKATGNTIHLSRNIDHIIHLVNAELRL